jgi:hypothetical protein
LVLAGIDTPRLVGVDPGYLGRVNASDGAPALEHAYAVTIYQAQGATVDSAFVVADPSMDRQEFYVAASRSRGETYFYATPETQLERAEIAPHTPPLGLEHIAAAAERDGAQSAAHDAAMREELGKLSTPQLYARRGELAAEARAEAAVERSWQRFGEQAAESRAEVERIEAGWRRLGPEPGGFAKRAERDTYKREVSSLGERERHAAEVARSIEAGRSELAHLAHDARAEIAVAEHLIAERLRVQMTAVRLDPPRYILNELGERPAAGRERDAWDQGALTIERYRAQHGIGDRDNALGREPGAGRSRSPLERSRDLARKDAQRRLRESERQLAQVKQKVRQRDLGLSIGR